MSVESRTLGRWALLSALVIAAAMESCNPAPKYANPALPAPVAYKELVPSDYKEGQGWKVAAPGDDKIRGDWWAIYGDPDLNALEEQVKISNQSIIAAEANYRQAQALVVSARSSLFPTLSGSASYTNSRFSSTSKGAHVIGGDTSTTTTTSTGTTGTAGTGATGTTGTTTGSSSSTGTAGTSTTGVINDFSLPLTVSYEFDFWHRVRNTIAQNAYQAQASAADIATALLSTQATLAQDYFQVRALDRERQVLDETVASYRSAVELTTSLYKTGIDSDETVSQAQTQLDTSIAQATDLGVSRAQYEHAIAVLIGKPPANFSLPVKKFNPSLPPVPVGLPSVLLERRPDIAAQERLVAAANAQIGIARAAYYPNISLSATGGFESSTLSQWFQWPSRFWSLGPQISGTIFDVGARRALNEGAQAAYDAAVANYRQTVLTVFQAVEDNLAALRILNQEVGEQRTAVNSAQHTLDLSLSRFKFGVDSYLNVISAQTAVLTNRETEVQVELRQMTASVQLVMALGGGWDESQLPQMKDMIAKPSKQKDETPKVTPAAAVGTPNPPPLYTVDAPRD